MTRTRATAVCRCCTIASTAPLSRRIFGSTFPFVPHITIGTLTDRLEAKRLCDELNQRGLRIDGAVKALTVAALENGRIDELAVFALQGCPPSSRHSLGRPDLARYALARQQGVDGGHDEQREQRAERHAAHDDPADLLAAFGTAGVHGWGQVSIRLV